MSPSLHQIRFIFGASTVPKQAAKNAPIDGNEILIPVTETVPRPAAGIRSRRCRQPAAEDALGPRLHDPPQAPSPMAGAIHFT
ncbi:hypothetical protein HU200_056667 [Digitaria exilis]|uniref:Uncharacterized protein n=1 Tax=Digitaria exilis TaxID=1010633 RepID=A0A835AGF4_9POAL|nr:hypothetical protein HU200_056667 [Digitaria exilis]